MKKIKKQLYNFLANIFSFAVICGTLGAYAGASDTSKAYRRFGIPIFITLFALYNMRNWQCLILLSMIGVFCLGYGIPNNVDKGSPIGRFWYYIVLRERGNYNLKIRMLADCLTRGTIGILTSLSLLIIPIMKDNWNLYILGSIAIILVYSLLSWRDLGNWHYRGKYLLWSEFVTYFTIGLVSIILILK